MVGERRKVLTFPLFLPIQQHARIHALINSERKESLFELEDYPNISLSLSSIPGWLKMLRKIQYIIYIIIIREGVKKKRIYLGLCPKHRTPPTHRARLGLH